VLAALVVPKVARATPTTQRAIAAKSDIATIKSAIEPLPPRQSTLPQPASKGSQRADRQAGDAPRSRPNWKIRRLSRAACRRIRGRNPYQYLNPGFAPARSTCFSFGADGQPGRQPGKRPPISARGTSRSIARFAAARRARGARLHVARNPRGSVAIIAIAAGRGGDGPAAATTGASRHAKRSGWPARSSHAQRTGAQWRAETLGVSARRPAAGASGGGPADANRWGAGGPTMTLLAAHALPDGVTVTPFVVRRTAIGGGCHRAVARFPATMSPSRSRLRSKAAAHRAVRGPAESRDIAGRRRPRHDGGDASGFLR